jgi:hypothetical protein
LAKPPHRVNSAIATLTAEGFDVDGKDVGAVHYRIKLADDAP